MTSADLSQRTTSPLTEAGVVVNDVHSRLNPTRVARVVDVRSAEDARAAIMAAGTESLAVCVAGVMPMRMQRR